MKKKNLILVAMATAILATSCAEEQQFGGAISNSAIALHPTIGKVGTRATETTTANLHAFRAYSFLTDDNVNYMDGVTYSNSSGGWNTSAGSFYWPVKGELNFYCYAPETPGKTGTFAIDPSSQKLTGFAPFPTAAAQQDLVYAKATGSLAANATSGLDVNFSHALSEVTIAAKNTNAAYTVEVSGVKLGNVISEGDFTFPSVAGADASWSLGTERSDYTTEWQNATTLSSTVSSLDASNTAFMLIPQQLAAQAKAIDGNHIALKVKITMQGGQVVHDGWAYVAIPTLWEMNKHYAYTLDFSEGAGQDENGNDIISDSGIKFNVTVTPWDEENIAYPRVYISGTSNSSNSFKISFNSKETSILPNTEGAWKLDITDENFTNTRAMFQNCKSLTQLDISRLKTSDVIYMSYMFNGCSSLESLDLSNFDTNNVKYMYEMFSNSKSLKKIDVSSFDTQNVTDMQNMFSDCNSLEVLNVYKFNTSKVRNMDGLFTRCKSLTSLDVSSWNTGNVANMAYMFLDCSKLKILDVSKFDTHSVVKMVSMFSGCQLLTSLDLSSWNTKKVTDMSYMFNGCKKLINAAVRNFNTESVTSMNGMFGDCNSLETLDLSGWNLLKVKELRFMFSGCKSLASLDLSSWNTTNVADMTGMFNGCSSLKSIYMLGSNEATIAKIKQALTQAGLSTDIVKTTR